MLLTLHVSRMFASASRGALACRHLNSRIQFCLSLMSVCYVLLYSVISSKKFLPSTIQCLYSFTIVFVGSQMTRESHCVFIFPLFLSFQAQAFPVKLTQNMHIVLLLFCICVVS